MVKYVEKKRGVFWPSKEMKKIAFANNEKIYEEAEKNPVKFWEKLAEGIDWNKKWTKAYEEKLPYFSWFLGGKLNFCYSCLDRHVEQGRGEEIALIWVPEPLKEKTVKIPYKELYEKVSKFAGVLKKLGVKKRDTVAIYLPMIPEALISMLACTRIGAIHSVVFSAFAPDALKARIQDAKSKILITADGYYRKGNPEILLDKAKDAIKGTHIEKVIVVGRLKKGKSKGKFLSFEEELKKADEKCPPVFVESNETMFLLYTSGTTGKPKGVIHDTGGYAVQAYWTTKYNFNLKPGEIMWCTADVGWITGHTYAFYGPLLNGSTTLIYEGSPDFPDMGRWWKIIEENKVTVFYTAPTAIRMFMRNEGNIEKYNLNTLKILGTVGEPIDIEAWMWYFNKVGGGRCPITDTWWQTETGGTLINALPGIGPFIPTVAGQSFPGTKHIVVDEKGKEKKKGELGFLVQVSPFAPGMLRGIYKNEEKYIETYWSKYKTMYDTSDGAYITKEGLIRITGRTDDVMKVAGHRLATAELENAINENPKVSETAVVPIPDEIKGQTPVAFVILKKGIASEELEKELKKHVDETLGPTARPSKIYFVEDLPKTRSGKIMRRVLKALLNNKEPEGLMTLVNPECVKEIKKQVESV